MQKCFHFISLHIILTSISSRWKGFLFLLYKMSINKILSFFSKMEFCFHYAFLSLRFIYLWKKFHDGTFNEDGIFCSSPFKLGTFLSCFLDDFNVSASHLARMHTVYDKQFSNWTKNYSVRTNEQQQQFRMHQVKLCTPRTPRTSIFIWSSPDNLVLR